MLELIEDAELRDEDAIDDATDADLEPADESWMLSSSATLDATRLAGRTVRFCFCCWAGGVSLSPTDATEDADDATEDAADALDDATLDAMLDVALDEATLEPPESAIDEAEDESAIDDVDAVLATDDVADASAMDDVASVSAIEEVALVLSLMELVASDDATDDPLL